MNYFLSLLIGLGLGFIGSLGLGPVTLLVINRSLHKGSASGYLSGLGSSISDTIYASVAAFGITMVVRIIQDYSGWFKLGVSVVLLLVGLFILLIRPGNNNVHGPSASSNGLRDFMTCFLLAFSNPFMIIVYLGLFGFFNVITEIYTPIRVLFLVAGIFIGANGYWFFFSRLIHKLGNRVRIEFLHRINLVIGLGMLVMAVIAGFKAWSSLIQ